MTTTSAPRLRGTGPRSAPRLIAGAFLAFSVAACGGDEPASDADAGPAGTPPPAAGAADTAPPGAAQPGPGAAGDTTAGTGADRGGVGDTMVAAPAGGQGDWTRPPLRGTPDGSRRGVAVLRDVRTGRHQGYDRVVFEFGDHIPEYTIRFVQDVVACGSGERVDAGGAAALEVDRRPAAAHDDEGNATVEARLQRPGLPTLRTARITCDFEAIVTWVLGLDHRASVRTLELGSPPRLVVDVRHR